MALAVCALVLGPAACAAQGGADAEAQLVRAIDALTRGHWRDALTTVDALLARYPDFRLAHLLRGDLLTGRVAPLTRLAGPHADTSSTAALGAEAQARLRAQRERPTPDAAPRHILRMPPGMRHAIVVDGERSRLFLFRNERGAPRLVADFYASVGKLGVGKRREGDQKTPVGVYRAVSWIPDRKLDNFYGSGAYPLDYPNAFDLMRGQNGHGIWIHGAPRDTYARAPQATDGCIVLANDDLEALYRHLDTEATPVIVVPQIEWASATGLEREREALLGALERWRKDWESRDIERYAQHYSRDFATAGMTREAWLAYKRRVQAGKAWVAIDVKEVAAFLSSSPGDEYALTSFVLDYRSNDLSQRVFRRLFWVRENGRWVIVREASDAAREATVRQKTLTRPGRPQQLKSAAAPPTTAPGEHAA